MITGDTFASEPVVHVLRLYDGLIDQQAWERTASEQIAKLAERLPAGHRHRPPGPAVEVHNWLPQAGARSAPELFGSPLSIDDAREAVARAHGFSGWSAVQSSPPQRGDPVFERAVEDLLAGDMHALLTALASTPDLV